MKKKCRCILEYGARFVFALFVLPHALCACWYAFSRNKKNIVHVGKHLGFGAVVWTRCYQTTTTVTEQEFWAAAAASAHRDSGEDDQKEGCYHVG